MARGNPVVNLIVQTARRYGVDPRAALAVASVEGGLRFGAVGDQGTSYGPFQLHVGGALPRGRGAGWANSPAGIDYALRRIAGVARGKRGRAAVAAIVRGFERPADPASEIAKALSRYGGVSGGGAAAAASQGPFGAAPPTGSAGLSPALQYLLNANNALIGVPSLPALPTVATPPRSRKLGVPLPAPGSGGAAPKVRGRSLKWLEHFAAPFGLTITSTTGGKHVKNSYHYRGRAVDVAGPPDRMLAIAQYAIRHPGQFSEVFYDPLGFFVKGGKVYKGSIGGHRDHVHLAR